MNKQFDGYNDLHNTYSAKGHKPSKPELDRLADRPKYKALYENQLAVNKGLLWGLGITLALSTLLFTGMYSHNKAVLGRLQSQYDTAYKYMIGFEDESNYYKTELASVSAELQLSKLSYKAKQDMKFHPIVVDRIKYWVGDTWPILVELYSRESSLNPGAVNKSSGACGLVQALPCSKMACSLDDIDCQINWGTKYINQRYGSAQAALNHSYMTGWY